MAEEFDLYELPPEVEAERLRSLDQLHVLKVPEDRFAHITRMARVAMGVPMSAINFMERNTQWCKQYSADHELHFNVPRDQSVCRATIARAYQKPEDPALVYEDLADSEFAELPSIAQEGGVRFYAGFPLFGPGGHPVGTFCVYDTQPRKLSDQERATFEELAAWTQRELESSDYQRALEIAAVGMCLTEPEGRFLEVNDALCEYFGYDAPTLVQKTWQDITAPAFLQADLDRVEEMLAGRLDSYRTLKQFINADGDLIWGDLSVACIRGERGQIERFVAQIVDVNEEIKARDELDEARRLLAASADSMLDPQVLFQAVREPGGRIIDFTYVGVNRATCLYLQVEEQELLGSSAMDSLPNLQGSGLLARYAECVETGEPVVLTDFSYFNEVLDDARRYDIQATRAGADLLSLTWSDVTDRFQAAQRLAESEQNYRLLAENIGDVVAIMRDGRMAWISPSCERVLGAPPAYWIGREVRDIIPADRMDLHADRMQRLASGGVIQERSRVQAADGRLLWIQLTLKTLLDADGRQDGYTASFRVIDAEVAAEQAADEARKRQAEADARYRRFVDKSITATALLTTRGQFLEVNQAFCQYYGYDAATLLTMTWRDLTVWDDLDLGAAEVKEIVDGTLDSYRVIKRYRHADGHLLWGDLSVTGVRDDTGKVVNLASQITDITATIEATQQYRLLAENSGDLVFHVRDGRFVWLSPSVADVIGGSPDYWVGRGVQEMAPPDYLELSVEHMNILSAGGVVRQRARLKAMDGRNPWVDVHARPFYTPDGRQDGFTVAIRVIDDQVAAEEAADESRRQQALADARYRRSIDNAAVGMCIVTPEGRTQDINDAMCRFFGYDAEALIGTYWQDVTAPEYLKEEQNNWDGIRAGRIDSYRMVKHFQHADGRLIWGDLSVSGIRDDNQQLDYCVALITDITARVEADERNRLLAHQLQQHSDRTKAELDSAASYMQSILPDDLHGQVDITSRYLPALELGGDGFHFRWLDEDHLKVYLVDVSGHGIRPALLSASVHNLIRTDSLSRPVMLHPDRVLNRLNSLFPMEQQDNTYFTMFYGIYQPSTRTLTYASAGHPPALVFHHNDDSVVVDELSMPSLPVGTFDDTIYNSATYTMPAGAQLLIYSDGAFELPTKNNYLMSNEDFARLCATLAARPDWSLDTLVNELKAISPNGEFDDDCALVLATFP